MDIGKLIAGTSVRQLLVILISGIFVFALIYFTLVKLTPDNGIVSTVESAGSATDIRFLDCLYFSVVTVSSLGYGDFRPMGLSRAVVALEVLAGLVFIAVMVARITSDRTATMVKLLYTAELNRVLVDFNNETRRRTEDLTEANTRHDDDRRLYIAKGLCAHLAALRDYIDYHLNVGELDQTWAIKKTTIISRTLGDLVPVLVDAAESAETRKKTVKQLELGADAARSLLTRISEFHGNDSIKQVVDKCERYLNDYHNRKDKGQRKPLVISEWLKSTVSSTMFNSQGTRRSATKIAQTLGLSTKSVQKTLDAIDETNSETMT